LLSFQAQCLPLIAKGFIMPRHVRKGDLVQVITGDDKGRQGTIMRVITKRDQVLIQGINVHKKHIKPNQQYQQGAVIDKEMPVHISNVLPVVDGKPTRVKFVENADGSKLRVSVKTGAQIGQPIRKAPKK